MDNRTVEEDQQTTENPVIADVTNASLEGENQSNKEEDQEGTHIQPNAVSGLQVQEINWEDQMKLYQTEIEALRSEMESLTSRPVPTPPTPKKPKKKTPSKKTPIKSTRKSKGDDTVLKRSRQLEDEPSPIKRRVLEVDTPRRRLYIDDPRLYVDEEDPMVHMNRTRFMEMRRPRKMFYDETEHDIYDEPGLFPPMFPQRRMYPPGLPPLPLQLPRRKPIRALYR